jgi:PmbA protein
MHITQDSAKKIVAAAIKAGANEAEIYFNSSETLKIDIINQNIESTDGLETSGISLRIIKDKKLGFAYTSDIDEGAIDLLVKEALDNSKVTAPDENHNFSVPQKQTVQMELIDTTIAKTPIQAKIALAMAVEKAARELDKRVQKTEKVFYEDTISSTVIVNSNGVSCEYKKSICGIFAEVIALHGDTMETGTWYQFSTKYSELSALNVGQLAAKRAADMLGAGPEKSGRTSLILAPQAATVLISTIAPALSADHVQKGKSLFINAIDKPVASRKLTLIDSGILANGLSSVPFDDEGTPTKENVVISNGILKTFLHNSYTAKKGKSTPTANAFRMSFKSLPDISPTNMYVKPGSKPQKELIDSMSKGFLIETIMGAHTVNPISGDFSIGFSGHLIENGKITRPVRGMTLSGNIMDVFNHIEDIGSDLMFFPHSGSIGAPSILIANLSVSGT